MAKEYLGDGVYADTRGYQIVLTTENGYRVTNTIYLEPEVLKALILYNEEAFRPGLRLSREEWIDAAENPELEEES